jgi:tetrahydromethanopterin S-methyltransferase subunit B
MQKQPTASSRSASAMTLSVTRVFERMPRMCTPFSAAINSFSPSAPGIFLIPT